MSDQQKTRLDCPECGKRMIERGVMLQGNVLLRAKPHPVWRLECPDCEVLVGLEMDDQDEGWRLWEAQNAKLRADRDNDIPF